MMYGLKPGVWFHEFAVRSKVAATSAQAAMVVDSSSPWASEGKIAS